MRLLSCSFGLLFSTTIALAAEEHVHFDLSPYLDIGKVAVGGLSHASDTNPFTDESTGTNTFRYYDPSRYVFEYEFGEDPFLPNFASDPGLSRDASSAIPPSAIYNAISGTYDTSVPANSTGLRATTDDRIRVSIIDDLKYWNEIAGTFVPVPNGETLSLSLSGANRVAGTGAQTNTTDFPISWASGDSLHLHASTYLFDNTLGDAPTDGVYLLTLQMASTMTGVAASDPVYIVWGFNADESAHEAAVDYAANVLVPEPATLGLLAGAGLLLMKRRR